MGFPYLDVFLGLLLVYMVYSVLARLDSRYLIAGALVVLVAAAVADAAGNAPVANTLAEYVFLLLAGGVILLLIEHVRSPVPPEQGRPPDLGGPAASAPQPAEASQEGKRPAEESLDGGEE